MDKLTPEEEADRLLAWHEGAAQIMPACVKVINEQFQVLQARTQFLLTLSTLTLTITGFSGPKIAETSALARYSIAIGIVFVLASIVCVLIGTLSINWITQITAVADREMLVTVIDYRNRKTRFYRIELLLLVIGLACYVASVVTFLISAPG